MPAYNKKSTRKLRTCSSPIQALMHRVVTHFDNTVLCGLRTKEEQTKAFRNNASKVNFPDSKHNGEAPKHDVSDAVDIAPYPIPDGWGDINGTTKREIQLDWKSRVKFYGLAEVVKYEWKKMQEESKKYSDLVLVWGGDWDGDGDYTDNTFDDLVHYHIIKKAKNIVSSSDTNEEV